MRYTPRYGVVVSKPIAVPDLGETGSRRGLTGLMDFDTIFARWLRALLTS